jgi:hypothetical protein
MSASVDAFSMMAGTVPERQAVKGEFGDNERSRAIGLACHPSRHTLSAAQPGVGKSMFTNLRMTCLEIDKESTLRCFSMDRRPPLALRRCDALTCLCAQLPPRRAPLFFEAITLVPEDAIPNRIRRACSSSSVPRQSQLSVT